MSDDGRYVTFISDASTLGCSGNVPTYFIRDRTSNRTYAPLHRTNGQPAMADTFASDFGASLGGVSGDGSTFVGTSSDWAGAAADDIGISGSRLWSRSAAVPSADC